MVIASITFKHRGFGATEGEAGAKKAHPRCCLLCIRLATEQPTLLLTEQELLPRRRITAAGACPAVQAVCQGCNSHHARGMKRVEA